MDCNHARFLLNFVRPGRADLDAADHAALQAHLQNCSECGSLAQSEYEADHAVARAIAAVDVPAGLRDRLMQSLARNDPGRIRRRWLTGLATAAALLIACTVAWFTWLRPLPRLDFQGYDPVVVVGPTDVEAWFADKGVTMAAPRQLNYDWLSSFDTVLLQGQRVPRLLFARGGRGGRADIAEVYVLSDEQFDFNHLPESAPSGRSMRIEHSDKPGFAFLIVYNSESLEPFRPVNRFAGE